MKKYLRNAGFRHSNNNDLKDKEFYLQNISFDTSDNSTLQNTVLDRTETYIIFLRDFDSDNIGSKMISIVDNAMNDGVDILNDVSFVADRVENGYEIQITFVIKG